MPTHYEGSDDEKRALNVYIKLMRAAESVGARCLAPVTAQGLTSGQFGVLESLLHLGPLTLGTLAEKHLKSPNNLTIVVDNLERNGMVRRERDSKDRRVTWVHLTDKGRACIAEVFPLHTRAIVENIAVLTVEEQQLLENLLRRLGKGVPRDDKTK